MSQEIPFIQYLMPNGKRQAVAAQVTDKTAAMAKDLLRLGYVFEIEMLRNGLVSQTVTDDDSDIAIRVSTNDGALGVAREELITEAHAYVFKNPSKPRMAK